MEIVDVRQTAAVCTRAPELILKGEYRMGSTTPFIHEHAEIQAALQETMPWSPLDFIRGISLEGDKQIFLNGICRPLVETNDLRFVHCDEKEGRIAVMGERLAWDSNFFGYGIAKLHGIYPLAAPGYRPFADYTDSLRGFLKKAKEADIRYVFTQVDARDLAMMRVLGEQGFCLIEPRIYFQRGIREYEYLKRYSARLAREEDLPCITAVARDIVNIYDRFHADPFITKEEADRLMEQWIRVSLSKEFSDVVMVPDLPGEAAAVVTGRYLKQNWDLWKLNIGQVVLGASNGQAQGWAVKLLSELIYHFCDTGIQHMYFSTQVTNVRIIKLCEHLGLRVGKTEFVFRKVI